MGNPTHEELAASMTAPFGPRFAELERVTVGVGGGAVRALKDMQEAMSAMPGLGSAAADRAAKLRGDTSLPLDHRSKAADGTLDFHRVEISKNYEYAVAAAARYEAELTTGLLPKLVKERELVRDEIRNVLGNRSGQALATAALKYVGSNGANPGHVSELLSDWGRSLYVGQGVEKSFDALKAAAVAAYMKRTDGTDRQMASRTALQAFKAANVPGALVAHRQSGLMYLNRDAALPPPGQLQVTSVTARGKTVKR